MLNAGINQNEWTYIHVARIDTGLHDTKGARRREGATTENFTIPSSTDIGNSSGTSLSIGATTLNGAYTEGSTLFVENIRITDTNRYASSTIPASIADGSSFVDNGLIQKEADVLLWNDTNQRFEVGGNYGRAFVSTSPPAEGDNGRPLVIGQFWYNTDQGELYQYTSGGWQPVSSQGGAEWISDLSDVETGTTGAPILLFDFEGTPGATDTVDQVNGYGLTYANGAALSDAQAQFGTTSLDCTGSKRAKIENADSVAYVNFETMGDFTLEMWVYATAGSSGTEFLTQGSTESVGGPFRFGANLNAGSSKLMVKGAGCGVMAS